MQHVDSRRDSCPKRAWAALAAAAAALFLLLAGLPGVPGEPASAAQGDLERVIVEFTGEAGVPAGEADETAARGRRGADVGARRRAAGEQQDTVLARARGAGVTVRESRRFTLLLNAVAAEVPAADVERLRGLPGVAAVHPDRRFAANLDVSVPLVEAPAVWEQSDGDGLAVTGAGRTVAIVDTGVDYTHPALGGGFGPGHKVVAGYDYVHDDADPMDDHGHGTHVAGIVAGEGDVTGVAPGATLTAYKVLDRFGGGSESAILAAIENAADPANPHRADVINLSLGGPDGDGTGPLDRAVDRAAEAGIVVVAAAGNSGPWNHTISSPASAERVLAVGASMSGVRVPSVRVVAPEERSLEARRVWYSGNPPDEPLEVEVVDVANGFPDDYEGLDVEGKAVMIRAPADEAVFAAVEARARGAVAVLFYGAVNTPVHPGFDAATPGADADPRGHGFTTGVGPGSVFDGRLDGAVVVDVGAAGYGVVERLRLRHGGPVTVRIDGADATDEIAGFSSRGPTHGYALKPEIAAPGVLIDSAVPAGLHPLARYRLSGTSMAAPHVAGAAALLRQLHPAWPEAVVRAALVGSAQRVDRWGPLAQGAGRLDVARAAGAEVVASPPALSLGVATADTDDITASGAVTLSNLSGDAVEVEFRHEPHAGNASVTVQPERLTIEPGADAAVTVAVSAQRPGGDIDVTGWIAGTVAGGQGTSVRLPYALSERSLTVHVPDPAFGEAEAFVYSPVPLDGAPSVTVTAPSGDTAAAEVRHDHGRWWRAALPSGDPGVYRVDATATTAAATGASTIAGAQPFEVLAAHQRLRGASAWEPVGPDSDGGQLATAGHRGLVVGTDLPAGLFVTGDGGRTWRQHADLPVAAGDSSDVAVDPTDPERIYYAVNGGDRDPTYRGRLLASDDGGRSWTTLPFPDVEITTLDVDPTGQVLLVATRDGLSIGRDRGRSWERMPLPWPWWELRDTEFVAGDLYFATSSGLWVLPDAAGTAPQVELVWEPPGDPLVTAVTGDEHWLFAAAIGQEEPRNGRTGRWFGEVHRSGNGGETWQVVTESEQDLYFSLDLLGTDVVATAHGQLTVGSGYGSAWTRWAEPAADGLTLGVTGWEEPGASRGASGRAGRAREILLGEMHSGVWGSSDGEDWRRIGVQGTTVHALAVIGDGRESLLAGTRQGLYRTDLPRAGVTPDVRDWGRSGGEGWFGVDITHLAAAPDDPATLHRVRDSAVLFFDIDRSQDGGETWETRHTEAELALDLLVHPAAGERVYLSFWNISASGLLVSDDGGEEWAVHYHPDPYLAVAGDPGDPDRLWLGNHRGLYRSDDGGATAQLVRDGHVNAIEIDPRTPDRIVAGGDELLVSSDGGETFSAADRPDLPLLVSTIVTSPGDEDTLFAGSRPFYRFGLLQPGRGVLVSRDGGRTWETLSDGLQNRGVVSLALSGDGRYLYAGTVGGGVHRLRNP